MYVREIMSREVVTLNSHDNLDVAGDIMNLGRIRHLPVVSDGRVIGMMSQRDLFRGAISSALRFRPGAERQWLARIPVKEVMATPVVTAQPDWTIRQAIELMIEKRIGCLPVVEADRLVGLVSESDCLRLLAELLARAERPPAERTKARP
jgi:acetoin utilization protein AcuB